MYLNSLNQIHTSWNIRDLNPMDYYIWSRPECMVYAIKITDVAQLKQHVTDFWKEIPHEKINKAINALAINLTPSKTVKSEQRTYWTIQILMLFWSAKVVLILIFFQFSFILAPVRLWKWSFSENPQNSKKQVKLYKFLFCLIFVLKGLLSRNFSHPAFVKKKIITFCLGGTFLTDPAFKLFVFSIESRKLLHT